jgi:hypothetical protein
MGRLPTFPDSGGDASRADVALASGVLGGTLIRGRGACGPSGFGEQTCHPTTGTRVSRASERGGHGSVGSEAHGDGAPKRQKCAPSQNPTRGSAVYNRDQWIESFEGQLALLRPHLTQRVLATMSLSAWHEFGLAGRT